MSGQSFAALPAMARGRVTGADPVRDPVSLADEDLDPAGVMGRAIRQRTALGPANDRHVVRPFEKPKGLELEDFLGFGQRCKPLTHLLLASEGPAERSPRAR